MTKIKKILISVLMVCVLFGCSSKIPFEEKLAGTYIIDVGEIDAQTTFRLRIKANGEASLSVPIKEFDYTETGTWEKVDDEKIVINIKNKEMILDYKEEKDSVVLSCGDIKIIKE